MEFLNQFLDVVLHLREHIGELIAQFGPHIYTIFFLVIFCETGLVLTPFLPGDSLLFTAGAFAALGQLNIWFMFALLSIAAILGDTVNYWIGHYLGPKVFKWKKSRFFNPEHLQRTHAFYEKYGGKTIILARFVPIIRTFAPFVAGIGLTALALLFGAACAGRDAPARPVSAVATAMRNPGLALVIATVNKLPSEVVASVFAYALGLVAVVTAFVAWQGRRAR